MSFSMDAIIAYTNQINRYSHLLIEIRDKICALFENEHADVRSVDLLIVQAEELEIKFDNNVIALHFFYYFLAEFIYKYRNSVSFALDKCLECCDKDIALATSNTKLFHDIPLRSLVRKSIIMEKKELYEKAIEVCEIGIKYNFGNEKESFEKRKEKIIKSIKRGK